MFCELENNTEHAAFDYLSGVLVFAPCLQDRSRGQVLVVKTASGYCLPCQAVPANLTGRCTAAAVLLMLLDLAVRVGPGTSGWLDLLEGPVLDDPALMSSGRRVVCALYGVMIPEPVPPKREDVVWMAPEQLAGINQGLLMLVTEALRRW